jgi:hypothetical protein
MSVSVSRQWVSWPVLGGLCGLALLGAACSPAEPAPPPAPALWGDMKPVVSVKELMRYVIDPLADNIFNSVSTVVTKAGIVETTPTTDADWEQIQIGAVSLAEGAYLLKVPRPFAPADEPVNSSGAGAVELTPAQMKDKVERDPVEWNARIETLRNAALSVSEIVRTRDANALWEAGEILDQACENCHRSYWYPGEDAAFYRKLRSRLNEYRQLRADSTPKPTR